MHLVISHDKSIIIESSGQQPAVGSARRPSKKFIHPNIASCDQDSVMEFGFEPVCDQVRAGSSYLNMSRQLEPTRTWSQTGSQLV